MPFLSPRIIKGGKTDRGYTSEGWTDRALVPGGGIKELCESLYVVRNIAKSLIVTL